VKAIVEFTLPVLVVLIAAVLAWRYWPILVEWFLPRVG